MTSTLNFGSLRHPGITRTKSGNGTFMVFWPSRKE